VYIRQQPVPDGSIVKVFGGAYTPPARLNPHIDYGLNPAAERYMVYVPKDYTGAVPYGLIVFTSSSDSMTHLPPQWKEVLDARHYILIAAQNAGNNQPGSRRFGLAVMGAVKAMQTYAIDPRRVYAAGISGGARISGILGFYQPDMFRGTLQNCGADFYKDVPVVYRVIKPGESYGVFDASDEDIAGARSVRFALITGTGDFRRREILDIYNGGFKKEGFHAKLFDVNGMGHETANANTLLWALYFLETGK
jgi:hypothetical protein